MFSKLLPGADRIDRYIRRTWDPQYYEKEKGFEDDLIRSLRHAFPKWQVSPQHGTGRTKADIVVIYPGIIREQRVAIEMKHSYRSHPGHLRLMGQICTYAREYDYVIAVLCGMHDRTLVDELKAFVKWLNRLLGGDEDSVRVVTHEWE